MKFDSEPSTGVYQVGPTQTKYAIQGREVTREEYLAWVSKLETNRNGTPEGDR